jgi:hypothetical protein
MFTIETRFSYNGPSDKIKYSLKSVICATDAYLFIRTDLFVSYCQARFLPCRKKQPTWRSQKWIYIVRGCAQWWRADRLETDFSFSLPATDGQ